MKNETDKEIIRRNKHMYQYLIPDGVYCYNEKGNCPFWDRDFTRPEQANGYCYFLEKGDWQLNKEINDRSIFMYGPDKGKTVSEVFGEDTTSSLLWDQCKECGINDGWDEDE
jgi:hypothetical protein